MTVNTQDSQRRYALYRRISSKGQLNNLSMDTQLDVLTNYVNIHGGTITKSYSDPGRSAWKDPSKYRPGFVQLLEDAAADAYDEVLVYDVDRLSRSTRVGLAAISRLSENNKKIVFVTQPDMIPNTPDGKFWTTLGLAMAQYYSDRLSMRVVQGKLQRRKLGQYNGTLPFGAIKGKRDIAIPDMTRQSNKSTNYDGYIKLLELSADGYSTREIAETLNYLGYRTTGNRGRNLFTKDGVRAILNSKFYLGFLPDGDYGPGRSRRGTYTDAIPGNHAPFVDVDLWTRAQQTLDENSTRKRGHPVDANSSHAYSLQGLLYCAYCGGKIHMHTTSTGIPRVYCYARGQGSMPDCAQRGVALEIYDAQVEQYLRLLTLPQSYQDTVRDYNDQDLDDVQAAQRQARTLHAARQRLIKQYQHGDIAPRAYRREIESIDYRMASLVITDSEKPERLARLSTYLQDLSVAWRAADPSQQHRLAVELFDRLYIMDGTIVGFQLRVRAERAYGGMFERCPIVASTETINLYAPPHIPTPARAVTPINTVIRDDEWPVIAARQADGVGLRTLAREFGTSHETIRQGLSKYRRNTPGNQAA